MCTICKQHELSSTSWGTYPTGDGETGTNPRGSWSKAATAQGIALGLWAAAQGRDVEEEAGELDVRSWSHGTLNPSKFLLLKLLLLLQIMNLKLT